MLTFIPLMRFLLGVLNWILLLFEAILAVPLMSLSLLKTDGDGFATQQFQSNLTMLLGVILRPILMAIGLVLGLIAFNAIMGITNMLFEPAVNNMTPPTDNSLLTLGIYISVYASLSYTLANSAFKAIDMLPNWVMNWIGARMESRVDDASAIQQQSSSYIQTMAYSNRADQADLGNVKANAAQFNQQAETARSYVATGEAKYQGTNGAKAAWEAAGRFNKSSSTN